MIVSDNFLNNYDELKTYALKAEFNEVVNDVDGAIYPAICAEIPEYIQQSIIKAIEQIEGFQIDVNVMFLRANPHNAKEPYQAHNDLNMGNKTFILYLTERGGTAFVEHIETGMNKNEPNLIDDWLRDCNNREAWEITHLVDMKQNRALFFDAELMHRGEPIEGYGKGNSARMILVCFYNRRNYDC